MEDNDALKLAVDLLMSRRAKLFRKRKNIPFMEIPSDIAKKNTQDIDAKLAETEAVIVRLSNMMT